jgi:hypothetical protein
MPDMTKMIEQRKHKRFQVIDGSYAVLGYKPTMMGQIVNLSKDGLAVCYKNTDQHINESFKLDILKTDSNFYIEQLHVKTISDIEISDDRAFGSQKIRRRGVQFEDLNAIQLFQLYYFLQNYTVDRRGVKDRRQELDNSYSLPERRQGIDRRMSLLYS